MPATGRRVPLELAVRREDIDEHIEKLSFSFFYKYSRFEFALKEHGYLRHSRLGCSAMPGWHEFAKDLCGEYRMSPEAAELIGLAPNSQVIAANGRLEWKKVNLDTCLSELEKIILVVQTCQWRSKKGPPRRCKKGPLGGCGLVPVVHGRAPRATRRALNRLTRRRAREGPVGPRGQAWAGWSVQLAVGV